MAAIEERKGLIVACLEEIVYRMGYIGAGDLRRQAEAMSKSAYGQYLLRVVDDVAGGPRPVTGRRIALRARPRASGAFPWPPSPARPREAAPGVIPPPVQE